MYVKKPFWPKFGQGDIYLKLNMLSDSSYLKGKKKVRATATETKTNNLNVPRI